MKGKIYKIPLLERFTSVNRACFNFSRCKPMTVDSIGLYVYYDDEKDITVSNIRQSLIGVKDTRVIVVAKNVNEALDIFYAEWDGAKLGGKATDSKALWVNPNRNIVEYPSCNLLNINSKDERICGKEITTEEDEYAHNCGEFGWCTLDGYDTDMDCPVEACSGFNYELKPTIKTCNHKTGIFKYESCDMFLEWSKKFFSSTENVNLED